MWNSARAAPAALAIVLAAAASWALAAPGPAAAAGGSLRPAPDPLRFAVYRSFPPFSDSDGARGIDVELASLLAKRLGREAKITAYQAGESVEDDLRYILWGGRRADVLIHVPGDTAFAGRVPQVRIVAPYYRERIVIAYDPRQLQRLDSLEPFTKRKLGVRLASASDGYLMTALGGRLVQNVRHYLDLREGVGELLAGGLAAVMGESTELEGALGAGKSRVRIVDPPPPGVVPQAWDVAVAVRAEDVELARALDGTAAELRRDGGLARLFETRGVTYVPPRGPAPSAAADGAAPSGT